MGVWIDRVAAHYRAIFTPPKVRVSKRNPGTPPDFPLHADGQTDRNYYLRSVIGAALLDAAGIQELHGLIALRAMAQPTDTRGCVFSALKAAGVSVDWAARSVTMSDVSVAVMRSDNLRDILGVWQCADTVIVVDGDASIDPMLDNLLD